MTFRFALIIPLLAGSLALAESGPQNQQWTCSAAVAYQACKDVDAEKTTISFSGGSFRNSLYEKPDGNFPADYILGMQASLLSTLNHASQSFPMSDEFKMRMLGTHPAQWIALYDSDDHKVSLGGDIKMDRARFEKDILSHWPPADQKAFHDLVGKAKAEPKMQKIAASLQQPAPPEHSLQELADIFFEAKQNLLLWVSQGRSLSELNPDEKSMYQRIQTVGLSPAPDTSSPACFNEDNAFYFGEDHTVHICKGELTESRYALALIFGHEIGHSLDACRYSMDLLSSKQSPMTYFLSAHSLVNPQTDQILSPAISASNGKIKAAKKCLTKDGRFLEVTKKEQKADLDLKVKYAIAASDDVPSDPRFVKQNFPDSMAKDLDPNCYVPTTHGSQLIEAQADMFGAVALNQYLKDHPLQGPNKEQAVLGSFFLQDICKTSHPYNILGDYSDNHPLSTNRWGRIFLQFPEIAKIFNCKADPEYACFPQWGAISGASTSRVTAPATDQQGAH